MFVSMEFVKNLWKKSSNCYVCGAVISFIIVLIFILQFSSRNLFVKLEKSRELLNNLGVKPVNKVKNNHDVIKEVHHAVSNCHKNDNIERCKDLLNILPNAVNVSLPPSGYTPFLRACLLGCEELIICMIRKGANVEVCTFDGDSAIYLAVYCIITQRRTDFKILQILCDSGCAMNVPKRNGYTALHLAARFGHAPLVRWLLSKGADPAPSCCKITPWHLANKFGHTEAAALLYVNLGQMKDLGANDSFGYFSKE